MSWLCKTLSSSVGKKFAMGITGLLLCGFLLAHLAGNLLLYLGPKAYNGYAHALHSQEALVKVAEVGLVLLFVAHIFLAARMSWENRSARRVEYAQKETKIGDGRLSQVAPDTWMLVSGLFVLAFLLLHLVDFTFEVRPDLKYGAKQPFPKAVAIMRTPLSCGVYFAGCLFLWAHLGHGVSSAFQSLGLNHPKYNPLIKWVGVLFAAVIAIGFVSFPVWASLYAPASP